MSKFEGWLWTIGMLAFIAVVPTRVLLVSVIALMALPLALAGLALL